MESYDSVTAIIGGRGPSTTQIQTSFNTNSTANSTSDGSYGAQLDFGTGVELDPYVVIHAYFALGVFHVAFILIFWFIYCQNGVILQYKIPGDTLHWWVYMSALISFCLAWGPVVIVYPFIYLDTIDAKYAYLLAAMASIDGPMLLNAIPIALALVCYF